MKLLKLCVAVSCLFASVAVQAQAQPEKRSGLKMPESAVSGPDGRVYVSEMGEFGKDGDGQITVVGTDGVNTVLAAGMDDPKGLIFVGKNLYVADKTRVLKVAPDGTVSVFAAAEAFPIAPQFLNDLEADAKGTLYVSDSGDLKGKGGAVFRIGRDGKVSLVVSGEKDERVLAPNGLLMAGKGGLFEVDFVSGILYRIDLRSGKLDKLAEGFGGGDGIVRGKAGLLYVSDWKHGKVFSVTPKGEVKEVATGFQSAADIGLSQDGRFLLVPDMKAGELHWVKRVD